MPEGSAVLLSPKQEEFMKRVIEVSLAGIDSAFIFCRPHGRSSIRYEGAPHVAWSPAIDDIRLKELSQLGLITIEQKADNVYRGTPTAVGIAYVTALAKSPESGARSAEKAPDRGSVPASSPTDKRVQPDLQRMMQDNTEVGFKAAAEYLGVSTDHVRRLARDGKLVKVGEGRPRISVESLRKYKSGSEKSPA